MGKADQYVFGLDLGTRSVVGTVGYKKNATNFTVVAQEIKMLDTRAMLDGQIHDIGKVAETIKQVKRGLEKQLGGAKLTEYKTKGNKGVIPATLEVGGESIPVTVIGKGTDLYLTVRVAE